MNTIKKGTERSYNAAMQPIPESFEFEAYKFEPKRKQVQFSYKTYFKNRGPLLFTETLLLPRVPQIKGLPAGLLEALLTSLHLVLGVSYYKLYCPPKIQLPYALSSEQAVFWDTVYKKGLGEFCYRNQIDPKRLARFPYSKKKAKPTARQSWDLPRTDRSLLGIGGGKDSIVAGELLKEHKKDFVGFIVERERKALIARRIAKTMGVRALNVRRLLDAHVLTPPKGAYKGHIPISAIFAFLGFFLAVLYDYKYVAVGNEASSNFGNLRWRGLTINHQWSKSLEFETLFQEYTRRFLTPDIVYFSALRPFYEIRIVEMFSKYKKYFSVFSSCNRSVWCGACPKCVFLFTLLSAFLSKSDLLKIFSKNLYEEKNLLKTFRDLLGLGTMKPFDCVGTFEEMRVAFQKASEKYKNTIVMKSLLPHARVLSRQKREVFESVDAPTMPIPFRLLGIQTVLVLGYGREGKATRKFLKKRFPKIKILIGDQKQGPRYLKKQEGADLVFKTPGMPKRFVTRPFSSATNLFFSLKKNFTIAVTGSKGKSTTASLIAHILKKAGKKVRLLGNIGKPMLSALESPIAKNEIFVLELSSYQLEDLKYSPNIAIVTDLFPEHMTHHGSLKNYYEAKENIIKHQSKSDIFVYNPKNMLSKKWAELAFGKAIPFISKLSFKDSEIPLLGVHNKDNVRAAVTVARILGVKNSVIHKAVKSFKALPHRLEFLGTFRDISFYDDAISTTPESTILALETLKTVDTIFLGGEDRGYDFSTLEQVLRRSGVRNVALFPETGKRILQSQKGFRILKTRSMEAAVRFAFRHTAKGKICLLSTASPSYSLWRDFEEKGEQFQSWVRRLA